MKRLLQKLWRITLGTLVTAAALWLLVPFLVHFVPLPAALLQPPTPDPEFVDRNGITLRAVPSTNGLHGRIASLQEVPDSLVRATLAAEDKRFWQHHGLDGRASARAAIGFIRNGRVVSGGSTISQQVIKLAEPRPRTLRTKLLETAQEIGRAHV